MDLERITIAIAVAIALIVGFPGAQIRLVRLLYWLRNGVQHAILTTYVVSVLSLSWIQTDGFVGLIYWLMIGLGALSALVGIFNTISLRLNALTKFIDYGSQSKRAIKIYRDSLNPNIELTYFHFIVHIIPLAIGALFIDGWLMLPLTALAVDNMYTRRRMTIPAAIFLFSNYETSRNRLLQIKRSTMPFAVPTLVLDEDGHLPMDLIIRQDSVRVYETTDWQDAVRFFIDYSPHVIMDMSAYSEGVAEEVSLIAEREALSKTVFLIDGHVDPKLEELVLETFGNEAKKRYSDLASTMRELSKWRSR